jgi:hypothetical protein
MIGIGITMLLFMWALRELIGKVVNCMIRSRHKHKWEFYDCGYTYGSSYIELRCKKCGEIKHIECDIDTTKWDIEYTEDSTGGID